MPDMRRFEKQVQKLNEILTLYNIAEVESYSPPNFENGNLEYAVIMIKPYNLEVLENSIFYASAHAAGHGKQSSIKGVYDSEINRYSITLKPDQNIPKISESDNHPFFDETERFICFLSKGIASYEKKSKH